MVRNYPWLVPQAVDAIERFLAPLCWARVIEWGCGASTVWLASRCDSLRSIEHDPAWASQVESAVARLDRVEATTLIRVIAANRIPGTDMVDNDAYHERPRGDYDLAIVDGRNRVECFKAAIRCTESRRGMVVLDNSERAEYERCFEIAQQEGMTVERFVFCGGHPWFNGYAGWGTSIFRH